MRPAARGPACPICKNRAEPRADNPSSPFCSERCKLIDLGNWASEGYRIPGGDGDEQGERDSSDGSNGGDR